MLKAVLASCILCIPLWSAPIEGKPTTLVIEGSSLSLGMTKSQVATMFMNFKISSLEGQIPTANSWIVITKEAPFRAITNVSFDKGKVNCIYKYYDNLNDENPVSIANTLNEILSEWTQAYGSKFTIQANSSVKAELVQRQVVISYRNRHLYITSTEGVIPPVTKRQTHTAIYETLD